MTTPTPTFVTEIPLRVTPAQETTLNKRFEAARNVYNACLGEALKRLDLMRQSKAWRAARKMPKGAAKNQTYRELNEKFGFRKYDLHHWAKQFGYSWLGHHLDSQTVKQLASRAFIWTEQFVFDPQRGRPRFKRYNTLNAVESINNLQGIIWRDERVIWSSGRGGKKLILESIINQPDQVMQHGLECRVKYVRLVRRELNGRLRFYAQLVNEGKPFQRFQKGEGTIGLKVGASTVSVVTETRAKLVLLCEELEANTRAEKRLQRKIDRQRRANNPANYNPDGTIKPRSQLKRWQKSNRQLKTEVKLREIRRRQREYRKSLHGQLINQIIQMGDRINLEKLSVKAWQMAGYGRIINVRAPGHFTARLKQKMIEAGGEVIEFSPFDEKLSQLDHQSGQYQKKPMSQRWHIFADGTKVQRNLYAAFLAMCLEDGAFNQALADQKWPEARKVIETALADARQKDKYPSTFGF